MTKKRIINTIIIMLICVSPSKSSNEVLKQTIAKLNSINTIEYQSVLKYIRKEQGVYVVDTAICFFDFTKEDSLLGVKYHFKSNDSEVAFDGNKMFITLIKNRQILYYNKPNTYDVNSSIPTFLSIYKLKKLLPIFLNDSSTSIIQKNDTIINGINNYDFNIIIRDKYLNIERMFIEKKGITESYRMYISKSTYLPTMLVNQKTNLTISYSKYNLFATRPSTIWNYDRFSSDYLRLTTEEYLEILKSKNKVQIGLQAPNFCLPTVLDHDTISLEKQKGNLVLIEFLFPGCGACVQAIPEINEISKTYSKDGLKVFGIEFTNAKQSYLIDYVKNKKFDYQMLYSGKDISLKYGIEAGPTFFLIDKNGIIVYASAGLIKDELIKAIKNHIF